ncbi:unnamed protein product [Rotaria sp. Silwood1]|nr:unnamed protein product [Rotaria sp. Silwood1]
MVCPRADCGLKTTLHAHCCLNCYREIRDAQVDVIVQLLTNHNINVSEEVQQKPQATGLKCPVEGCKNAPSMASDNRFCEELYDDGYLRRKLTAIGVVVAADATKDILIQLARQHLAQFLGKPKKIPRIRQ